MPQSCATKPQFFVTKLCEEFEAFNPEVANKYAHLVIIDCLNITQSCKSTTQVKLITSADKISWVCQ